MSSMATPQAGPARSATAPAGSTPRWTRLEAVLRMLRGVDAGDLAAEFGVSSAELASWRDEFLEAGVLRLGDGVVAPPEPESPADKPAEPTATEPAKLKVGWREQASRRAYTRLSPPANENLGLRERKKARTRAAIRKYAMRLFHEQGYAETTVNQIADAAEVSPSTFFRYFSTKEDVVFNDDAEIQLSETFRAVPAELGPVQAVFRALLRGMASTDDPEAVRQQVNLCLSVPELRAVLFDNLTQLMNEIAELVSERVDRSKEDFDVRTFSAAAQGVWYSVLFDWAEDPSMDLEAAMMRAAEHLENGFRL